MKLSNLGHLGHNWVTLEDKSGDEHQLGMKHGSLILGYGDIKG